MKVVFTDEALANLDGILSFIASNYPSIYDAFQSRLRSVVARIGDWPESAQEVADRPGLVAD
ncbi:MAG TPA: type II toxin-antitoxin system RelE/ParE family toxin [Gemmatimonadaceae bacterium]|jgi:plasmid stabilization system protein ParE|nr:type II toxin-antitoxin system RelE/ParE family toxin [Gemmatimonadaceae bacterium]HMI17830.1 type II toxin-antitoxin system RelE/ParE family toxin [Bradyrhizobium sp.]